MNKRYWEEILISLSLANLLFIGSWRRLIYPSSDIYHIKSLPSYFDYLSVWILVVITAGIFLGGLWLARRLAGGNTPLIAKISFLAVLIAFFKIFRFTFWEYQQSFAETVGNQFILAAALIVGILFLAAIFKLRGRIFRVARIVVLILSPFLVITFSHTVLGLNNLAIQPQSSISAIPADQNPLEKTNIKSRVVWIIFDELDYQIPFENPPKDLKLPEFDDFKNRSVMTNQTVSPAYDTLLSIPSLLTGRMATKAVQDGAGELILDFKDGSRANFSETPTVFSAVKNLGGQTAAIGYYHPYCRVLVKSLTDCHWEGYEFGNDFNSVDIRGSLARNLQTLLWGLLGHQLYTFLKKNHYLYDESKYIKRHQVMVDKTLEFVGDPQFDLVFIHLPIPHYPFYYDRHTKKFVAAGGYLDNLALTDAVLGRIRKEMEQAGLWDSSVVIVSSDHQWRPEYFEKYFKYNASQEDSSYMDLTEDDRIPFFIKLKNQRDSFIFEKPFNTVITHDLILHLIQGNINSPAETIDWLKENGKNTAQIKVDL